MTARTVGDTDGPTLPGFVADHAAPGAPIYTDDHTDHHGLRHHAVVRLSVKQYVDGQAHSNDIESFWASLKRGSVDTYYKMIGKYLSNYHPVRRGL